MYHIMYAGNLGAFDGILSSVISVVKFNPEPIKIWLLTMDLAEENPKYTALREEQVEIINRILQKRNPQSSCQVVDLTQRYREDGNLTIPDRFTPYAMLRLYVNKSAKEPRIKVSVSKYKTLSGKSGISFTYNRNIA